MIDYSTPFHPASISILIRIYNHWKEIHSLKSSVLPQLLLHPLLPLSSMLMPLPFPLPIINTLIPTLIILTIITDFYSGLITVFHDYRLYASIPHPFFFILAILNRVIVHTISRESRHDRETRECVKVRECPFIFPLSILTTSTK